MFRSLPRSSSLWTGSAGGLLRPRGLSVVRPSISSWKMCVLSKSACSIALSFSATQDRNELRSSLEEPAALTDGLIGAIELGGAYAVSVAQQAGMASGQQASLLVDNWRASSGFDRLGGSEVLLCDGIVRDACVDEGHARRAMTQQLGDGLEAHAPVDQLGGEGVAQLVGMDVSGARPSCHRGHVAVDGPTLEGLAVVADDQQSRGTRTPTGPVVGDEVDEHRVEGDVPVVVELSDRDPQPVGADSCGTRHRRGVRRARRPACRCERAVRP